MLSAVEGNLLQLPVAMLGEGICFYRANFVLIDLTFNAKRVFNLKFFHSFLLKEN